MLIILQITANDNIDKTHLTAQIIFAIFLIVGTIFLVRYLLRRGLMCPFCCDTDLKVFDRISEDLQEAILDYFRSYELREPDRSRIFVCDKCKTVFDDFYEEQGISDNGVVSGVNFNKKIVIACKTYCKVCNSLLASCDPEKENIHCRKCDTQYQWKIHERSGYRFLMAPRDVEIQKKCKGFLG